MWGRPSSGWRSAGFSMQLLSVDFKRRPLPSAARLQAGLARGPLMSLAPLPCRGISGLLKGQTHREKLRKGQLEGRSHIYHHVTARHNTWAHVCDLYLPRAPYGRPGTRAAAGEEGASEPGREPPTTSAKGASPGH